MKKFIINLWGFVKCAIKNLMTLEFLIFILIVLTFFYISINQIKQNDEQLNRLLKSNFYSKYCNINAMEINDNDYKVCKTLKAKIDESLKLPEECDEFDTSLIKAIKKIESNHNSNAVGDGNISYGLMQIQYNTAKDVGFKGNPKDLLNPRINMKYGCLYLSKMYRQTNGNLYQTLDAYNRGPNAIKYPYKGDWSKHQYVGKIIKELKK